MKRIAARLRATVILTLGLMSTGAWACETCRPRVEAGIYNEHFVGRLALTLMPLLVVLCLVALIVGFPWGAGRQGVPGASARRHASREES